MNRRLLGVLAAALLAVVGTIAIVAYVRDADARAQSDVELVDVFVVDRRVAAGSDEATLRRSITTEQVQARNVVSGVVTDLAVLEGKVASVDLVAGEQLLASRLVDEAVYDDGRTRLTAVPEGKHEVTVSLDPERAIGGQVEPGDTVSVVASFDPFDVGAVDIDSNAGEPVVDPTDFLPGVVSGAKTPNTTHILLHKVLVTRVQLEELPSESTDDEGNAVDPGVLAPTGNLLVTLALDAPEIERLVFTAEFGRIWLTYEPIEASEDGTVVQTRGSVYIDPVEPETPLEPVVATSEEGSS